MDNFRITHRYIFCIKLVKDEKNRLSVTVFIPDTITQEETKKGIPRIPFFFQRDIALYPFQITDKLQSSVQKQIRSHQKS